MNPNKTPLESLYALGLIIQALKFIHEEYADEIKGSSSYQAPLTTYVQKLSIICQSDIKKLYAMIDKHKGNQDEEALLTPYYAGVDFVKEVIETTMLLATVKDARFGVQSARDMLAHVRKQVADGPKPVRKSRAKVKPPVEVPERNIHPLTGTEPKW
jgi:hypothetical protein